MKTTKMKTAFVLLLSFVVLSTFSCKKKTKEEEAVTVETVTDDEQESSKDNNTAENTGNDIEAMSSEGSENTNSLSNFKGAIESQVGILEAASCATVTSVGKTFTIDFGTSCVGSDGKTRSGSLIYTWANSTPSTATRYRNPGFNLTMTTNNYVVDAHTVTGIHQVTNTTPTLITTSTNLTWSVVSTYTIQKPGGGTITWTANRTKELMNTNDTLVYRGQGKAIVWNKAKVKHNGTAGGTNASNETYGSVVTDLVRDFNCSPDLAKPNRHPFISGTIVYTPAKRLPRTINYGSGACDKEATITINGKTYSYQLW